MDFQFYLLILLAINSHSKNENTALGTILYLALSKLKFLKGKAIYVTPAMYTFSKSDLSILEREYRVQVNLYNWKKKVFTPFFMFCQIPFFLTKLYATKVIFIHFGGYWALIPSLIGKLFRIPVYIVLHGTDSSSIPSIGYGSLRKPILKRMCHWSYNLAHTLVPVSESLMYVENDYYDKIPTEKLQGVKHFFPNLNTPHQVISNGLDTGFWNRIEISKKNENSFVTVISEGQMLRKGGDLILEISKYFPDCTFYFAGCKKPASVTEDYKNVQFLGKLSPEELRNLYSNSQFYLQLSIFEGFGLSLCEAMLCECIPIGSSVNAIPEIIGNTGYIVNKRSAKFLIEVIHEAIKSPNKEIMEKKARSRIIENYSLSKREELLLKLFQRK